MKDRNLDNHNDWKTPDYVYNKLNEEFKFDFDPCPLHNDIEKWDGLRNDWSGDSIYCNPPYQRILKEAFIAKAIQQSRRGKTVVMLLPVSTSTKVFHELILPTADEIRFVSKRIKFQGVNTKGEMVDSSVGMHDSMIVIFRPNRRHKDCPTSIIIGSQSFE